MNNTSEVKRRRLTLKDLELEVKTEEQVKGGLTIARPTDSLGIVRPNPTLVINPVLVSRPTLTLPGWAMGPRSDSGAGDASAWNEGDITLAEEQA
ncbi:MAG TPA: hypothetical protein VK524_10215 [Polyangiaceae bacterium]|nr:hypothetical protein [Polyangiaceae bacterium]